MSLDSLQAKCSPDKLQNYRNAYTFETDNLIIAPVTTVEEYQQLISISKDDKFSYMYKDLYGEYGFPKENEDWEEKMKLFFANDKFCAKTTLPILFAAYKKDNGDLIGFYAYFPRKYDYYEHTRLEQRSLLSKNARSGGLGTEFRRAMIQYFKKYILNNEFDVLSQRSNDIRFRSDTIEALISGVEASNFASLISNIRACLPISQVDQTIVFALPNSRNNPVTADELRKGYCDKVIVYDDLFARDLTSKELNPLVCDDDRPQSIQFDKNQAPTSAHNIAYSINKVIEELEKQRRNCE